MPVLHLIPLESNKKLYGLFEVCNSVPYSFAAGQVFVDLKKKLLSLCFSSTTPIYNKKTRLPCLTELPLNYGDKIHLRNSVHVGKSATQTPREGCKELCVKRG